MGFSGSVNGTTKNPGFLDFGFCQCKWAYNEIKINSVLLMMFLKLTIKAVAFFLGHPV